MVCFIERTDWMEENTINNTQESTMAVPEVTAVQENISVGSVQAAPVSPGKKKKKKKGPIIAIVAIVSVLLIAGAVFLIVYNNNKEYFNNKWAMMTKTDLEYFRYVADRQIEKSDESLKKMQTKAEDRKVPDAYRVEGNIKASMTADFGIALSEMLSNFSLPSTIKNILPKSDFAGIEDLGIRYEIDVDGKDTAGALITPSYKGVDIISLAGQYDNASGRIYLGLPSYDSRAINVTDIFDPEKNLSPELKNIVEKITGVNGKLESIDVEKLKESVQKACNDFDEEKLNELIHIIYDKVEEVELDKEELISVNDLDRELNVFTFKFSKKDCIDILKKYIKEIKSTVTAYSSTVLKAGGKITPETVDKYFDDMIAKLDDSLKDKALTLEVKLYSDDKGDILGGSVKVSYDEKKIKIDCLKLKDEQDENKSRFAMDVSLNSLKILTLLNETEKEDDKVSFSMKIKPGALVESILRGGSRYVITASGSLSGKGGDGSEVKFDLVVNDGTSNAAELHFENRMKAGKPEMPLDISEANTIDLFTLHESDYISVQRLGNEIVEKVEAINDENFNTFIDNILSKNLGMDLEGAKAAVKSGLAGIADPVIKQKLKDLLGIEDPYDYGKLSEKPREEEGKYVYSWDILNNSSINSSNLSYKVYDHFRRPEIHEVDMEKAKADFLAKYVSTVNPWVEMGDYIVFDAAAKLGPVVIDSYSYTGLTATVGNYEYGPGNDDKLLGMQVGQTKDVEFTLGDYFGSFSGYTGTFRITVTSIDKAYKPEWSWKFIVEKLGYNSLEECEKQIYNEEFAKLPESIPAPTEKEVKQAVFDDYVKSFVISDFDADTIETVKKYINEYAAKNGGIDAVSLKAGFTDKQDYYRYMIAKYAVVANIAYAEKWTIEDSLLDTEYQKLASELGFSSKQELINAYEGNLGKRFAIDAVFENRAVEYLYGKTNVIWD